MPPEITIPLRAVYEDPHLALELVSDTLGPGALDAGVRWAHVSELRDPAPFLVGGELLLTAGVNLPEDIDVYVRGLLGAGVTALGFGITPAVHDAPPASLRQACVQHGLPLLVVDPGTPFLAISRAVALALAESNRREQRRFAEAREALTRAAARSLDSLTGELARRLDGWVALLDGDDRPVTRHRAPQPLPVEVIELLTRSRRGSGIRSATTELPDGTHVVVQPSSPQSTASQMLAVGRQRAFGDIDRSIMAAGAALLGLSAHAGAHTASLGAATTALLLGRADPNTVLSGLHERGSGNCHVVAGAPHRRGPAAHHAAHDWLSAQLQSPLVEIADGPRFTAIVAHAPTFELLEQLRANGWITAVSSATVPDKLPAAARETDSLLHRARSLGTPVVAERSHPLADLVPADMAADFSERTLAPLLELDRTRNADLITTLRAWLAHHGGWDRTAAALGVHRNSVRHRINQIEQALGADLADPEVRMELWFALRWR